jgi:ADP-ribose pyrophosphatase YjhB (NUDIX family)
MTDDRRRVTRVAAYALCTDGDAILLSRIAQGATAFSDGKWTLPGGGVEFGEDPRDAALRELGEETGIIGAIDSLADVDSWTAEFIDPRDNQATDFHAIRILYRVRVIGGELRPEVSGSSDACAWIAADDLDRLPLVDLARTGARLVGLLT